MLSGSPIHILLVEDDPAHAEIVRRSLEEFRVPSRITHVTDGQEALDYLYRQNGHASSERLALPDLILLDLRLPKVDGLQVLTRLKAEPELSKIPTVVLTTSLAEADLVASYRNGAGSYLVKPVDHEKFMALMDTFGFYWLTWNRFPQGSPPARPPTPQPSSC